MWTSPPPSNGSTPFAMRCPGAGRARKSTARWCCSSRPARGGPTRTSPPGPPRCRGRSRPGHPAVRARQRELLIPKSFEWIDEATPGMTAAAPGGGLAARAHPLMVLSALTPAPVTEPGITVRIVSRGARSWTGSGRCRRFGVRTSRHGRGPGRRIERDKIAADHDDSTMEMLRERLRSGRSVLVSRGFSRDGRL